MYQNLIKAIMAGIKKDPVTATGLGLSVADPAISTSHPGAIAANIATATTIGALGIGAFGVAALSVPGLAIAGVAALVGWGAQKLTSTVINAPRVDPHKPGYWATNREDDSDGDTESGGFDNPYGDTPDDFDSENAVAQPSGDPSVDSEQNNDGGGTNNDGDTAPPGPAQGGPGQPGNPHDPRQGGGGNDGSSGGPPGDGTDGNGGGPGSGPGGAPGGTGGGGGNGGGRSGGGRDGSAHPIVLDLDGDGVELVSLDESSAFYDINGDGYRYNLGWAGSDDGLLAFDKNSDGNITDKDEISFVDYVPGARTDLEGLRHFDSNTDGVLDAKDAEFAKFRVWQDADQDGEVDAGELRSLTDAGIRSIALNYAAGDDGIAEQRDGNTIFGEGQYTKTDGTVGAFADAAFAVSDVGYREEGSDLVFKVADGAESRMYVAPADATEGVGLSFVGNPRYASHIGMIGTDFSDTLVADYYGEGGEAWIMGTSGRSALIMGMGGTDYITGSHKGDWLVGGEGTDYLYGHGGDDVIVFDADDVASGRPRGGFGRVLGGAGFDIGIFTSDTALNMNLWSHEFEAIYSGAGDDILYSSGSEGIALFGGGGNDRLTGTRGEDVLSGDEGADTLTGGDGDDVLLGGDGADRLTAGAGDDLLLVDNADTFNGGDGWDTLVFTDDVVHDVDLQARGVERVFGGEGNDNFHSAANVASRPLYLYGGGGDDRLTAGVSKDFLHGGKGNDVLKGGYRDDTYYFARGDGQDLIFDDFRQTRTYSARESYTYTTRVRYSAGQGDDNYRTETRTGYRSVSRQRMVQEDAGMDVLEFGAGIVASDLLMQRQGEDLLIGLKEEDSGTDLTELSEGVRIKDWSNERNRIERFTFSDGTQLGIAGMMAAFGVVRGGAAIDLGEAMAGAFSEATLAGTSEDDRLFGGSNSDVIYGLGGDDILSGKAGADKLYGGAGSDRYMFARGDGQDLIFDDFRQMRTYSARESYTYTTRVRYSARQGDDNYRTETRTGYRSVSRQRMVQEDAGMDVLEFGAGIVASDLLMQRQGEDLLIGLKEEDSGTDLTELSEGVRIKDWSNERNRIERFTFSDGTQLGIAGMMAAFGVVQGGAAIDLGEAMAGAFSEATLAGTSEDDRLFGGSNSDVIYGLGGDDILSGKAGADKLHGGAGSDTYYFHMGDGKDTVHESGGASDRIVFGPDIGRDDIWLSRHGNDLSLSILGVEDELVVENQFSGTISHRVESFDLSDGSHLDWSHTNALIHAMAAFGKPEEGLSGLSTQDRESVQSALNAAWVTTSV